MHDVKVWDDCVLSSVTDSDPEELRTGDPNEDCTPDEFPDPTGKRQPRQAFCSSPVSSPLTSTSTR